MIILAICLGPEMQIKNRYHSIIRADCSPDMQTTRNRLVSHTRLGFFFINVMVYLIILFRI